MKDAPKQPGYTKGDGHAYSSGSRASVVIKKATLLALTSWLAILMQIICGSFLTYDIVNRGLCSGSVISLGSFIAILLLHRFADRQIETSGS